MTENTDNTDNNGGNGLGLTRLADRDNKMDDRKINKNALGLMDTNGVSQTDLSGKGRITLKMVERFLVNRDGADGVELRTKYGLTTTSNPIFEVPEDFNPFKQVSENLTGLEAHEVFLSRSEHINLRFTGQPVAGALNMPCQSYPVMEQLGRGVAQHLYGKWTLVTEFDGTEFPTNHWALERQLTDKPFRLIRARLEIVTETRFVKEDGQYVEKATQINKAFVDEWGLKNLEWFRHSIQARLIGNVVSWRKKTNGPWVIALSKYHWLGIFHSIDIGRPIGATMEPRTYVNLVANNGHAVRVAQKAIRAGFMSELWQLSGYSYKAYPKALAKYGALLNAPVENAIADTTKALGL